MSVGWGLRGFIGGGSLGAMIPGAIVALVLCRLLGIPDTVCGRIAAFGAIGIGFGGQETYGQTVRFVTGQGTFWWGIAGLSLKGAVWGLVGGAVLGLGLVARRVGRVDVWVALALMVVGTWLGWRLIDHPRLLYFSNPLDAPRPEIWAGLLSGGLGLLGWISIRLGPLARVPVGLAVAGALGGGFGFGAGAASLAAGLAMGFEPRWFPGWKQMEFTFGFCFGAALGLGAYLLRSRIAESVARDKTPASEKKNLWWPLVSAVFAGAVVLGSAQLRVRFGFTLAGAVLLALAFVSVRAAWQIALTLTVGAFAIDVGEFFVTHQQPGHALLVKTAALVLAVGLSISIAVRERQGREMASWSLMVLLWTAIGAAVFRAASHTEFTPALVIVVVAFVGGGALTTALLRQRRDSSTRPKNASQESGDAV